MSRPVPHVVIAGGGIAGLSAAWFMQKEAAVRGLELTYTVLEATDRWGGKICTDLVESDAGTFTVEGGADSFLTGQKPWGVELAVELGLTPRLLGTNDKARKVYVLSKGKPRPLPEGVFLLVPTKFKPFVLSPLISPLGKLRMGLEPFLPSRKDDSDETLADFVTRRLGTEALDKIAEPLMSGIYNAEADRQSLLATFPRFREQEKKHGSLIRAMLAARRATSGGPSKPAAPAALGGGGATGPAMPTSLFVSFRDGTEELIHALRTRLTGGLQTGTRLSVLERKATGGYSLVFERPDGAPAGRVMEADAVLLAIPAFTAAGVLKTLAPEAARRLDEIRYVSTGTITLAFQGEDVAQRLPGFGLVIPRSEKRPLNALTWSSTKFPHRRAPAGYSLLRAFFGGSRSPQSMELDDDGLLAVVLRELRDLMGVTGVPLFSRVYRWHRANPQYDVDHLLRMDALDETLPPLVWVTGSPYRGVGIPDCVYQARVVAERMVAALQAHDPNTTTP